MRQAKIQPQTASTKSRNKATQKAKAKRGKAGRGTQTPTHKTIQQKSHLSQTLNTGSHKDKSSPNKDKSSPNKGKSSRNQSPNLLETPADDAETPGTDKDSIVLHRNTNAKNVTNMDTSQVNASRKLQTSTQLTKK